MPSSAAGTPFETRTFDFVTAIDESTIPSSVDATTTGVANQVSWSAVGGATGYSIFWRAKDREQHGPYIIRGEVVGGVTSFTHDNDPERAVDSDAIEVGSTYVYQVAAVTSAGEGTRSEPVEVVATKLKTPTGISYFTDDGEIQLTCDLRACPGPYNIYWSTTSPVTKASTKVAGTSIPYVISGLTNGAPVFFRISAADGGDESALSNEVNKVSGMRSQRPNANADNRSADLSWYGAKGAETYRVYWDTQAPTAASPKVDVNGRTHWLTGLVNGTKYYLAVTAVRGAEESTLGDATEVTPHIWAPSTVTCSTANDSVNVSWSAAANADGYQTYNQIWKWSVGGWAWIGGGKEFSIVPAYGSQGTPSAANTPGSRAFATGWFDSSGNGAIFGGWVDRDISSSNSGLANDVWRLGL